MAKFVIGDVFGRTVVGTFSAWDHIIGEHPEMEDREEDVKHAISMPASVHKTSDPSRLIFRGTTLQGGFWHGSYVKVYVKYSHRDVGFVKTACLGTLDPPGERVWP